jgi:phosphoribosyl-AMP cyclohydrolase
VNELEEGTEARLEFGKIQAAAATSTRPLVPVVLQHADTLAVLFVGYADEEAVAETRRTGRATLWSTSRNELWRKGATSGDWLDVVDIRVNCEQNSLLYLVRPATGSACHTRADSGVARPSCYYRRLTDSGLQHL